MIKRPVIKITLYLFLFMVGLTSSYTQEIVHLREENLLLRNEFNSLNTVDERNNIAYFDYRKFLPIYRWNLSEEKNDIFNIYKYESNWYQIVTYLIRSEKILLDNSISVGLNYDDCLKLIGIPDRIVDESKNKYLYYGKIYKLNSLQIISKRVLLFENEILKEIRINKIQHSPSVDIYKILLNKWIYPGSDYEPIYITFMENGEFIYGNMSEPIFKHKGTWILDISKENPKIILNSEKASHLNLDTEIYRISNKTFNFTINGFVHFYPE